MEEGKEGKIIPRGWGRKEETKRGGKRKERRDKKTKTQ